MRDSVTGDMRGAHSSRYYVTIQDHAGAVSECAGPDGHPSYSCRSGRVTRYERTSHGMLLTLKMMDTSTWGCRTVLRYDRDGAQHA